MLPAAHRIRTAADFQQTTRRGTKVSRGRVVVYVHTPTSTGPARVGIITSSAIGGSVVRHRVARRIRAAAATVVDDLPAGMCVVVRALPGAGQETLLPQQVLTAIASAVGTPMARR